MFVSFRNKLKVLLLPALCLLPYSKVMAVCNLAAGNMAFGSYDVFSPYHLDSVGTLIVTCPNNDNNQPTTVTITMGLSAASNSIMDRKMKKIGGDDTLRYNLFMDATRASVWGNTLGLDALTQSIMSASRGGPQFRVSVFGRIPAGQDVSAGVYSDTVTVTIMP